MANPSLTPSDEGSRLREPEPSQAVKDAERLLTRLVLLGLLAFLVIYIALNAQVTDLPAAAMPVLYLLAKL